jgi:hypothetical protein
LSIGCIESGAVFSICDTVHENRQIH